jgi:hypothetical protein
MTTPSQEWTPMNKLLPTALVLTLSAAACSEQHATTPVPELLKRALSPPAPAASGRLYAYDFEDRIESRGRGEQTTTVVRGHVDMSREEGHRVTISFAEPAGDAVADPQRLDARYERDARGLAYCDTLSSEDVANAVDKGPAPGGRLFTFTPRPEGEGNEQFRDMMDKMDGEAVVDEASGLLLSFSAALSQPHNFMLVAEIKTANIKAECAQAPNGRAYATRLEFDFAGSGFGQSFGIRTQQTISNLAPAG